MEPAYHRRILSFLSGETRTLFWSRRPSVLSWSSVRTGRVKTSFLHHELHYLSITLTQVKLYDLRSFEKGPFTTFKMPRETKCEWTGLRFRRVTFMQFYTPMIMLEMPPIWHMNSIRIIVNNHSHINMKPSREVHPPHYQRERHAVARCIRRKATSGMTIVAK